MDNFNDHEIIENLSFLLPTISSLFKGEVGFLLADKEKIVKIIREKGDVNQGNYDEGDFLPKDIPAYLCMKENRIVVKKLDKSYFGYSLEAIATPIKNRRGEIIGSIAVGKRDWGNDLSDYADNFFKSFMEISKVVDGVSNELQDAAKASNDVLGEINKTRDDMKKTDEIISFVQNVSKQTNLLGLNAAIESARAGEMGKGFSVVANEIRNLSTSTSESIKEITSVLNKLKDSFENITNNINKNNSIFENQASNIEEINSSIAELNDLAKIIKELSEKI